MEEHKNQQCMKSRDYTMMKCSECGLDKSGCAGFNVCNYSKKHKLIRGMNGSKDDYNTKIKKLVFYSSSQK